MSRPTLDTLHTRVRALEERMETFDFEQRQIKSELQSNTRLTEDIHGDLAGIVEFVREVRHHADCMIRRSARIGKWLTATCGGGAALITLARVMGWW